jgi:hypothetical protein
MRTDGRTVDDPDVLPQAEQAKLEEVRERANGVVLGQAMRLRRMEESSRDCFSFNTVTIHSDRRLTKNGFMTTQPGRRTHRAAGSG